MHLAEMCPVRVTSKIHYAEHYQHLLSDLLMQLLNHFFLGKDLSRNESEVTVVFVAQKVPMRTSANIESTPKLFSVSRVLFMASFTSKREVQFKFCGLKEYMCSVDDDLNWCVLVICLQTSLLGLSQGPQKNPRNRKTLFDFKCRCFCSNQDVL